MPYISAQILGVIMHYLLESRMDIYETKRTKGKLMTFFIEKEKSKIERRSVVMPLTKNGHPALIVPNPKSSPSP